MIISVIGSQANSYAVGSVDRKGRFPIHDQIGYSYAVEKVLKPTASLTTPENPRSHPTTAPMLA